MARATDDSIRDFSHSVLDLVSLADRAYLDLRAARAEPATDVMGMARSWVSSLRQWMSRRHVPSPHALVGLLQGLLLADARTGTKTCYAAGRLRVKPSPIHPGALADTVLNVPAAEIDEFLNNVVRRYQSNLSYAWIDAALAAVRGRHLEPIGDALFASLVTGSSLSRLLCPNLDSADRRRFAEVTGAGRAFLKLDLKALQGVETLPGQYVAATVTLFRPGPAGLKPLAIEINGLLLRPQDGAAWDLAKYFVLQGAALAMIGGVHPTVHFPMDAINGITKAVLPRTHILRRLLTPHLYMQLPLNYAVLYISRSVAHNDQREIYTPFPVTKSGFFQVTKAYYQGLRGNSAYPAYRYPLGPPRIFGEYGRFIGAYYGVIEAFVHQVVKNIHPRDERVRRWADRISAHVPGFPDGRRIFSGRNLTRAVTTFICNVSVLHSADHHSYAGIALNRVPLRLRQPAPVSRSIPPLDRTRLIHFEDLFRHRMAQIMYFQTSPVQRLKDVAYDFRGEDLQRHAMEFRARLVTLDETLRMKRFIDLDQIATSIQF